MCGICGIIDFSGKPVEHSRIAAMTSTLSHRGPDDEGIYCHEYAGIGHRRLSILDLTQSGHQPMANEDNSVWIALNGEIYNYLELKQYLKKAGHIFKSTSDTEVIVHGYEEWGEECCEKLDGMFAFAIWDSKLKKLILARDPFAIKPLYYYQYKNCVIFGSEIKAIIASGLVRKEINRKSLSNFLTYFYTPGHETILEDVYHVKPGRVMVFGEDKRRERRYWQLEIDDSISRMSHNNIIEKAREECGIAVRESLVSDVPIGILLSSGLDSNIILSEMIEASYPDIQTITVGFREASFNEAEVVKKCIDGMSIQSRILYTEDNFNTDMLNHLIYHQDSLSANVGNIATYLIVKSAAQYVKVALAGAGNDELFAGYSTYLADKLHPYYNSIPRFLRDLIFKIAHSMPQTGRKYSADYLLRKFTDGAAYEPEKSHYWWRTIFTDQEKEGLIEDYHSYPEFKHDTFLVYKRYYEETAGKMSFHDQSLYADFFLFCNENANMMVDNLSMAFSLEIRPPFLTKRFVRFAFSVPYELKLRGTVSKFCLRKAYEEKISRHIIKAKKTGLVSPLAQMIRGPLRDMVYDSFTNAKKYNYFNEKYLNKMLEAHMKNERDYAYKIYVLMTFMRWHDIFMGTNRR